MIKFLFRFLLWFGFWFLLLLPLQLVGALILLFVCPLNQNKTLPSCLKWFDSADHWIGRNTEVIDAICESGWWNRYCYIAWRNPLNYFGYSKLGLVINKDIKQVTENNKFFSSRADEVFDNVGDSTSDRAGIHYGEFINNGKTVFEYYAVLPYSSTLCFRFRLGWKLGKLKDMKENQYVQWVFVLSPLHSFSGKI